MVDADFQKNTLAVALRVIRVCESMPEEWHARSLARELLHCGTAIGAHCRAAARARTPANACAKLEQVEDATDDTLYWLDLITLAGVVPPSRLRSLTAELAKIEQQVAEMIESLKPKRVPSRVKSAATAAAA